MAKTRRRKRGDRQGPSERRSAPDARRWLAQAAAAQAAGDLRRAQVCYGKFVHAQPHRGDVWHALAGIHHALGDRPAACGALENAVRCAPADATYLSDLGGLFLECDRAAEAEVVLRRAVELGGESALAEYNLSQALYAQDKVADAITCLQSLVRRQPQFSEAHYNLAVAHRSLGHAMEAIAAFDAALRLQPDHHRAHLELARLCRDQGLTKRALDHFTRYLARVTQDVDAIIEYAEMLHHDGETARAIAVLREHTERAPAHDHALAALGQILHNAGDLALAERSFGAALARNPDNTRAIAGLARVRRFQDPADPIITQLESALRSRENSAVRETAIHFSLGKIYDDLGEFDRAFEHFRSANALRGRESTYDRGALEARVARIIATFSREFVDRLCAMGESSELPVWFVGMPRSGTTLAEQVLASHPRAHGAGELRFMPALVANLGRMLNVTADYPECCAALSDAAVHRVTAQYLELLRRHSSTALRVSDKLPGNYFHLGLIAGLFPGGHIVSCRRDPMDVCLSIYFQFFREPHDYAWDLGNIGHFYAQYRRLMDHWMSIMPARILELDYEDMVESLEPTARRLVAFSGLDWDPACLAFHATRRDIKTASNWQVRQPLYRSSLRRWRNYARYLAPLAEALSAMAIPAGAKSSP